MSYTLEETIMLAAGRHMGQVDKRGEPYILHVLRVMLAVQPQSDATRTVALLHDTIEDTRTTMEDLEVMGFSREVRAAVAAITRVPGESYQEYIIRVGKNPLSRAVKLADLRDNLDPARHIAGEQGEHLRKKYGDAVHYLTTVCNETPVSSSPVAIGR